MKILLVLAAALSTACAGSTQPKQYPDYSRSSGIALDSLDARNPQVVENLGVVCRIWGYVKYHHPAFDTPALDADCELFGLLPRVAEAAPAERNAALYDWVRGLGGFTTDRAEYDRALAGLSCVEISDPSWIRDTARLGAPLARFLQELRYAKREKNRYTDFTPAGNFSMEGESTAGTMDDCGYRLLTLFRFWNVIEYFCPNRNLTDTPWNEIPEKYIPIFLPDPAPGNPEKCRLLAELCDSHAAAVQYNMFGYYSVPAEVRSADGRVFVIADGVLKKGDEILSIDGRGWDLTRCRLARFEASSNEENRDYTTARCMLLSHRDTAVVELVRGGRRMTGRLATRSIAQWNPYASERMRDTANLRLIADGVGYMTGLHYTAADGPRIIERFRDTKALVVDMRCYPREFMVFDFIGRYFLPRPTQHVTWLMPTGALPGLFYRMPYTLPVDPQKPDATVNPDYYKGRVVVLVDSSTQSQAEYTAMTFQAAPRCTVVGTQTAGADGNVTALRMPGGDFGFFSGIGVHYPDGTDTQRAGIRIDVPVHATVAGLQAGRDEILERALEIIRTGAQDPAKKE
ncbi:S41 family peptidase [Alistipes sp.]|uniref:S41 family peptidase n=1 Tax=Alistipes sp. TaxID=1872444 RepID=UPI003AF0F2E2